MTCIKLKNLLLQHFSICLKYPLPFRNRCVISIFKSLKNYVGEVINVEFGRQMIEFDDSKKQAGTSKDDDLPSKMNLKLCLNAKNYWKCALAISAEKSSQEIHCFVCPTFTFDFDQRVRWNIINMNFQISEGARDTSDFCPDGVVPFSSDEFSIHLLHFN